MKRIVNISKNSKEAANWDIEQQVSMTPEERQEAARVLKERVYGPNVPDVKEAAQPQMNPSAFSADCIEFI